MQGDPQTRLTIQIKNVALGGLDEDVVGHVEVPAESFSFVDESFRLVQGDPGTPLGRARWVRWRRGEEYLTLSSPSADDVTLVTEEGVVRLEFAFWRQSKRGALQRCLADHLGVVDLEVSMHLTVGPMLPVAASNLPSGYVAALVPVFTNPGQQVGLRGQAAAQNAQDWLSRAKTLIHGHSSSEDPRFGNGGLLGANFGGTVTVPALWWHEPEVQALVSALDGSNVELAIEGPGESAALWMGDVSRCEEVLLAFSESPGVLLYGRGDEAPATAPASGSLRGLSTIASPRQLDGRREALVETVFSQAALHELVERRAIDWFAAPLVATRNPLLAASQDSLLEPERGGSWTLHADLSRAFARAELLRETERLLITSASSLSRYWQGAQGVAIWQSPEGFLVTHLPGESSLKGFSLVVAAPSTLVAAGPTPAGLGVAHSSGTSTYWWDLPPGERSILGVDVADEAARLRPIRWKFEE